MNGGEKRINVLIVGANRGIGYYMVERLLAKGHSVTVLDVEMRCVRLNEGIRQDFKPSQQMRAMNRQSRVVCAKQWCDLVALTLRCTMPAAVRLTQKVRRTSQLTKM